MMPRRWAESHRLARTDGAATALRSLGGPWPSGPRGHAIVPGAGASDPLLAAEGLAVERRSGPSASADWTLGLVWVRLGLSERLLNDCVRYLREHTTGGKPLLDQQMVKGDLADVAIDHLEIEAVLGGAGAGAGTTRIHRQITHADRILSRLLGASGFLADGPGRMAYVSELLADVYGSADG